MEAVPNVVTPLQDVQVSAKAQRRRFTAKYKLKIVREADACKKPGELGALLRREGLYSSHLVEWRRARDRGELLKGGVKRGRRPKAIDPNAKRIEELERELAKATARAERAEALVDLQKKVAALLGNPIKDETP
jgi:transposase-like protein